MTPIYVPIDQFSGIPYELNSIGMKEWHALLERPLPDCTVEAAKAPLADMLEKAVGRKVIWVPALDAEQDGMVRELSYGDAAEGRVDYTVSDALIDLMAYAPLIGLGRDRGLGDNVRCVNVVIVSSDLVTIMALPLVVWNDDQGKN